MLHYPHAGQKIYEVMIYNRDVRSLVKENKSHHLYDDEWADIHIQDIEAHDESEARDLIDRRFPKADGFVVTGVCEHAMR